MGLDMHLTGEAFYTHDHPNRTAITPELPFPLQAKRYNLGYWRKHPNLHGYIVEQFAEGEDNCQEIELSQADIEQILEAIRLEELPKTEGFFFGASDGSEKLEDITIFEAALKWMLEDETGVWKSVTYRASW